MRVYDSRYRMQQRLSTTDMETYLGADHDRCERFKFFLDRLIGHMKSNSSARAPWSLFEEDCAWHRSIGP